MKFAPIWIAAALGLGFYIHVNLNQQRSRDESAADTYTDYFDPYTEFTGKPQEKQQPPWQPAWPGERQVWS